MNREFLNGLSAGLVLAAVVVSFSEGNIISGVLFTGALAIALWRELR